ncbi:hypothetical protein F0562_000749 [Nyssa sinensis]|uniref:WW domain-containing protein n=1 Tax=Nyssa sinensis TaxID=561372 RepID=A0A5J5C0Y7_9ASTE|nr:hypothetical protein F0562_000749 [Nyssa sinensis]
MSTQTTDILDCDWSEHTCPDGYMYYYNCVTCESKWEKPEEYALYEEQLQKQQQQNHSCQQPHCLSNPLVPFSQPVSQMQSVQPQTTLSNEKLQQLSVSAPEHDHVQVQAATSPVIAPACVQVV